MKHYLYLVVVALTFWHCSPNNVTEEASLEKYFTQNGAHGTFALLDNNSGNFTIHNLKRYRDSAFVPASTFKIVNSLIGLQTGIIENDSMVIAWDGVQRSIAQWNQDLNFYNAFRVSAVPYFQEVARRIGKDTMQQWLDTLAYGSKKINSAIDTFWLDGSLTIRPDEQMGLVKKLYFNQLPFHKINQEMVKRAMLFEDQPLYKLSYKTGWQYDEKSNKNIGWIVGWIEENRHPYFFVLNLEAPGKDYDMVKARMAILKGILSEMEFLRGEK
jgi:beta-lactamase class D